MNTIQLPTKNGYKVYNTERSLSKECLNLTWFLAYEHGISHEEAKKLHLHLDCIVESIEGRAYKEASETLLNDVRHWGYDLPTVKSANQLRHLIWDIMRALGVARLYILEDVKKEEQAKQDEVVDTKRKELSTSEIIQSVTEGSQADIKLDTNRAKNLLELASRKIRKADNTANWQAVARLALNYL